MPNSLYQCFDCGQEFEEDMSIEADYCPYCESHEFEMLEENVEEDDE